MPSENNLWRIMDSCRKEGISYFPDLLQKSKNFGIELTEELVEKIICNYPRKFSSPPTFSP